jgi:hypothetical protein
MRGQESFLLSLVVIKLIAGSDRQASGRIVSQPETDPKTDYGNSAGVRSGGLQARLDAERVIKRIGGPVGTAMLPQKACEKRASRNSPSFAVALKCGMGSSSLNAEVNAFDRLQIVRGLNSSYRGSK